MELIKVIAKAEKELSKIDLEIGTLISKQGHVIHHPRTNYFASLCRSILGQQVSVASALATFNKLEIATNLNPLKISKLDDTQARALGLSRQKSGYIRDLAMHFVELPTIYNHLESQTDEQIIKELTAIKGIGVWTAQMFLMFTLTRLDVFAPDDIGIQRGMKELYEWESIPDRDALIEHAERWRPYRTIACWHLWESLHNNPK